MADSYMVNFRFSPNLNQAHRIHWLPWDQAAFAKAQLENKPILLSVSAVWCYWCHVMDETSYSDPEVAHFINQHFIAMRVDNDHRPDINARYNVGGWPTTAFLTAHGGLIGGATYLPPEQLLAMLKEVQRAYQERKPELYQQARALLQQRREQVDRVAAGHPVDQPLVDRTARNAAGTYDPLNGGFGGEPKFPNAPVLQFLAHLVRTTGEEFYRVMLVKTLDRMAEGEIFDREEGGFFRHCANADWSVAQHEKLLEDNLALARVYLEGSLLLAKETYRQVACQTIDYLLGHLYDREVPGFHGSQGAHSEYFALPLASRRTQPSPPVDPSCYVNGNAQAVSLLLDASWILSRPDLAAVALNTLATIDTMAQEGRLSHVYSQTGPAAGPAFLTDWAHLLNALLDAYSFTSEDRYLERARKVAEELMDRFSAGASGGFFDIEEQADAPGYLRVREKPLPENVAAVLALLKLHHASHNDDYRQLAQLTISAYGEAHRDYGHLASTYALAVHRFLNPPVEITIEGRLEDPATQAMHRAAAQVPYPHLMIKVLAAPSSDGRARAHLCLNTVCLAPISDPAALADTVTRMISGQDSPFENILERFAKL